MCASLGRFVLVVINAIFLLMALVMIVIGGVIHQSFTSVFDTYLASTYDDIRTDVNATFGQDVAEDKSGLHVVFKNLALLLLVIGIVLFMIALFGFIGSCCRVKKLLLIYALIIIGFLIVQIVLILAVFSANIDTITDLQPVERETTLQLSIRLKSINVVVKSAIRRPLKELIEEYEGSNGTNAESWTWNLVMRKFECCGIDDYRDFQDAHKWWGLSKHLTPYMCCESFPQTVSEGEDCAGINSTISVITIKDKNYHDKGCLDAIWDTIFREKYSFIILAMLILFLMQIAVVVFAIKLYCSKEMEDDDAEKRNQKPRKKKRRKNAVHPGHHGKSKSLMLKDLPKNNEW